MIDSPPWVRSSICSTPFEPATTPREKDSYSTRLAVAVNWPGGC